MDMEGTPIFEMALDNIVREQVSTVETEQSI